MLTYAGDSHKIADRSDMICFFSRDLSTNHVEVQFVDFRVKFRDFCDILQVRGLARFTSTKALALLVKQFVDLRVKCRDFCDILQSLRLRALLVQKYLFY